MNESVVKKSVDLTKSYMAVPGKVQPSWYVVDATDQIVGRLATKLAGILMGKHRPTYTPYVACGDFVIVINADKVRFSGKTMAHGAHHGFTKKMAEKEYEHYTGYPGGRKVLTGVDVMAKDPTMFLHEAIRRMLPKNKLRTVMMSRLKLYSGPDHPHQAQRPEQLAP